MNRELEDRRLLAEITIIAFIAVAFHESLNTFRESLEHSGFFVKPLAVFAVFFLTALRFFIGNHLHLRHDELLKQKKRWLRDYFVILLEVTILGFLGCLSPLGPLDESHKFGFVDVLMLLYVVDIGWIFGVQVCERRWKSDDKTKERQKKPRPKKPLARWHIVGFLCLTLICLLSFIAARWMSKNRQSSLDLAADLLFDLHSTGRI